MELVIEVWLRGQDTATTETVDVEIADPLEWTEADVRVVLGELLRAIERARYPGASRDRPIALRGFSWIVSPFESGGHTIAVEIQLGAAATGPFDLDPQHVERLIAQAIERDRAMSAGSSSVH